jgi:hypothetical protein
VNSIPRSSGVPFTPERSPDPWCVHASSGAINYENARSAPRFKPTPTQRKTLPAVYFSSPAPPSGDGPSALGILHVAFTKPAWYRSILRCTAKPNFFLVLHLPLLLLRGLRVLRGSFFRTHHLFPENVDFSLASNCIHDFHAKKILPFNSRFLFFISVGRNSSISQQINASTCNDQLRPPKLTLASLRG